MEIELFKDPNLAITYHGVLKKDCSLGSINWLGVGGNCDWLYQPKSYSDLAHFLSHLADEIPYFVLGAGSNLIVRDGGYRGLVIRLGREFTSIRCKNNRVYAKAFAKDSQIATKAAENGIDLTFLRTIPGTIGGAVKMNAGCYGEYLADHLLRVTMVNRTGEIYSLSAEELRFSYRSSSIPEDAIIVEVELQGEREDSPTLLARIETYVDQRNHTQPTGTKTAGSTFRNPLGYSSKLGQNEKTDRLAWKLIDDAGLRGVRIGDAQVSKKHPNFLVNLGNATAAQVENLGEMVRREVFKKHGVLLEWEIIRIGELVYPENSRRLN